MHMQDSIHKQISIDFLKNSELIEQFEMSLEKSGIWRVKMLEGRNLNLVLSVKPYCKYSF